MKKLLPLFLLSFLLMACGSNKNYLERNDEQKALQDAIKKLNKNSSDEPASEAVPILYKNIVKANLARIKSYEAGADLNRWDKIIAQYNQLQDIYENIVNSSAAFRLVTPENFSAQLLEAKQNAAEVYYQAGNAALQNGGRDNAKKAYGYFKKVKNYQPNYKDAAAKMNDAYESAIVDVIINPIQDDRYFFNSGWGNSGYDYSNEYFQRTLLRDLSYNNNNNNSNYAARFYSDWEARRENVEPDWTVDLRLRNMNLPQPLSSSYNVNRSKQIQVGSDTAGKPIYQNVYATVNVNRMSFTANADMALLIKDLESRRTITNRNFSESYRWQQEKASYTGDSRALTAQDWEMINNSNFYAPRRENVLDELYKKLYPQVLNAIRYAVSW